MLVKGTTADVYKLLFIAGAKVPIVILLSPRIFTRKWGELDICWVFITLVLERNVSITLVCVYRIWYSMHAYLLVNHGNTMETKPYLPVAWKWYQFFAITISLRRLYDHTATATDASSIPPIHDRFSLISTKCMERYKTGLIIPLVIVSQVRFVSTICRNSIQEKCFPVSLNWSNLRVYILNGKQWQNCSLWS